MPDHPYTARRGVTILLVGAIVGIIVLAVAPSRDLERLRIDAPKIPATFALVSVSLDLMRYFRFAKRGGLHHSKVLANSREVLNQHNQGRSR